MNKLHVCALAAAIAATPGAWAQKPTSVKTSPPASPPPPPPPPPVSVVNPPGAPETPFVYDQKHYPPPPAPGRPQLVTVEQANAIVDKFKTGYPKIGSPRLVLFVNRELVDQKTGLRMIARTEKTEGGTNGAPKVSSENRYRMYDRDTPALSDRQTLRDVERLFGRPLRMGGATLADQRLATQLMPDRLPTSLNTEGEQARKDREALSQIAEVAVEVLISSRNVTVDEGGTSRTYTIPDIQATALRLKDARILAQAASTDATGRFSTSVAAGFTVHEIAEATALALMEDMLTGVEVPVKAESPK